MPRRDAPTARDKPPPTRTGLTASDRRYEGVAALSARLRQTLFYSLRLGLQLGQIGLELGDLLGLAPEPALEIEVLALGAMVSRTAAVTASAPASVAAATAAARSTPAAPASRVAFTIVVAVMPMPAMVFIVMPVMVLVVFVSLVAGHEQASLSLTVVLFALAPCSGVQGTF